MERATGVLNLPPSLGEADSSLLERVERGEEEAMMELFDRYAVLVYSVALRALRDAAEAEVVLREILLRVWRGPEVLRAGRGSVGGWLVLESRSCSIGRLRRRAMIAGGDAAGEVELASPCNLGDARERERMIERASGTLHRLPERPRRALEMAFFDGLTHAEIAEITGEGSGTVRAGIGSALAALRGGCSA
jgi:RNA polymerase sigma-70 factor, ECF subfamily